VAKAQNMGREDRGRIPTELVIKSRQLLKKAPNTS
jgi:hypothetical protein